VAGAHLRMGKVDLEIVALAKCILREGCV